MALEEQAESAKAAHDVLRRIGPVDAEDELLGAPRHESRLPLEHSGIVAEPVELRRVDADRVHNRPGRAATVLDRPGLPVDPRAEQPLHREQERPPPALGVKADDVVREQPLVHGDPQLGRERVPVVRLRPRDVEEVRRHDFGSRLPHQARREVQVVVVEENRGVGLAVELLDAPPRPAPRSRARTRRSRPRAAPARSRAPSRAPRGSAARTRGSGSRARCKSGHMQRDRARRAAAGRRRRRPSPRRTSRPARRPPPCPPRSSRSPPTSRRDGRAGLPAP